MTVWDFIVRSIPDTGIALKNSERIITYTELKKIIVANAVRLFNKRNQKVMIICANKLNEAIAILIATFAGKTIIPCAAGYGDKYIDRILKIAKPDLILRDEDIAYDVAINEDNFKKSKAQITAFLMFTSGTTGTPKGVMLSHKNIIFNIKSIAAFMKYEQREKMLIARPLSHISVLVGELLTAVFCGMEVHFSEESFNPKKILTYIQTEKITAFNATPTIFNLMSKGNIPSDLSMTKSVISGEVLTKDIALRLQEKFPSTQFFVGYGLTESAPRISMGKIEITEDKNIAQGKPLPKVMVKILHGRVFVKSKGIMRGYYKNLLLTLKRKKFGWLDTKDSGHLDDNGNLVILGRADEMIIRAGVNIYPQEIENLLNKNPNIKDCLAYGKTSVNLKVVTELDINEVFKICRTELPPHFVPTHIEIVDAIEKTPGGKKKRLTGEKNGNSAFI